MLTITGLTEVSRSCLFDKRRNRSLARLFDRLLAKRSSSFSASVGHDGRQAAARLFSSDEITPSAIISGHIEATVDRARHEGGAGERLLILQDTTVFVYTRLAKTVGLGPIGMGGTDAKGLYSHGALCATESGTPLGVVHLDMWARESVATGRNEIDKTKAKRSRRVSEKESRRWPTCVERVQSHFPANLRLLFIQDRESDMFELFLQPRRPGVDLLVRAAQARRVEIVSDDPATKETASTLFVAARSADVLGQMTVRLPAKANRPERDAVLNVRACPVLLKAPMDRSAATTTPRERTPQPVWLVCAREAEPPPGQEAVDWTLISTTPATTLQEARHLVTLYTRRWLIERLHFTIKSGLDAEELRMDDAHSLKNALALYYMVAWRLLHLTYLARNDPNQPANKSLDEIEIQVLSRIENAPVRSVHDAVITIAKLGGYRHYKNAKPPGVKLLWIGFRRLEAMIAGFQLALEHPKDVSH